MDPKIMSNSSFLRMRKDELFDVKGNRLEDNAEMDLKKFTVPVFHEGEIVEATAYVDANAVKPCYTKARDENGEVIKDRSGVAELAVDRDHSVVALGEPGNSIELTLPDGFDKKGYSQTKTISMSIRDFFNSINEAGLRKAISDEHSGKTVSEIMNDQSKGNTAYDFGVDPDKYLSDDIVKVRETGAPAPDEKQRKERRVIDRSDKSDTDASRELPSVESVEDDMSNDMSMT